MQEAVLSAIVALLFLPSLGFGQAALTDQQVIEQIIQQSLKEYHDRGRPCDCPDDRARDGSLCGGRSAYIRPGRDRKSTRLNSSHQIISYAVFCLKKKTNRLIAMKID